MTEVKFGSNRTRSVEVLYGSNRTKAVKPKAKVKKPTTSKTTKKKVIKKGDK